MVRHPRAASAALTALLVLGAAVAIASPDGAEVYEANCVGCHQADGGGIPGRVPPLAGSDFLHADVPRAIGLVLSGTDRPLTVNGERFQGTMPPFGHLDDAEVAAVLSWVLGAWGGRGARVTVADVASARADGHPRPAPPPTACGTGACGRACGCAMMRCPGAR